MHRRTLFIKGDRVMHRTEHVAGVVVAQTAATVTVRWTRLCTNALLSISLPRRIHGNPIIRLQR